MFAQLQFVPQDGSQMRKRAVLDRKGRPRVLQPTHAQFPC